MRFLNAPIRVIRVLRVLLAAPVFAALLLAAPVGALAQVPSPPETGPVSEASRLDRLFERLRGAPNAEAATPIATQIQRAFERSGSDTADLVLQRAKLAIQSKNFETALDLIDYALALRPDWAEAYHTRALIHFFLKDEDSAARDLHATLAREPRHFQALAGLGAMLRGNGKKKAALDAFRKVLELHPQFGELKETVEKLRKDLDGQPI